MRSSHHDDQSQAVAVGQLVGDACEEAGIGNERATAGVAQVVAVVGGGQLGVAHRDDGTGFEDAKEAGGKLDAVKQADEDAVFDPQAFIPERARQVLGHLVQLGVGVATLVVDDRGACPLSLVQPLVEEVVGHVERVGKAGQRQRGLGRRRGCGGVSHER